MTDKDFVSYVIDFKDRLEHEIEFLYTVGSASHDKDEVSYMGGQAKAYETMVYVINDLQERLENDNK